MDLTSTFIDKNTIFKYIIFTVKKIASIVCKKNNNNTNILVTIIIEEVIKIEYYILSTPFPLVTY